MAVTVDDADYRLVAESAPIRELTRLIDAVADETKVHLTPDGVEVALVDPTNVMMLSATFGTDAFETVETPGLVGNESFTIGTQVEYLAGPASQCRFSRGDTFELRFDDDVRKCTIVVDRGDDPIEREQSFGLISTDAIREEPTVPDFDPINNDDWGRFKMDPKTFHETIEWTLGGESDNIQFDHAGSDFRAVCGDGGTQAQRVGTVSDSLLGTAPAGGSLFSGDYISDLVSGLKRSRMERVEVRLTEDYPVKVVLTHQGWDATAELMVAPRTVANPDVPHRRAD
jgi:hypothetical protein